MLTIFLDDVKKVCNMTAVHSRLAKNSKSWKTSWKKRVDNGHPQWSLATVAERVWLPIPRLFVSDSSLPKKAPQAPWGGGNGLHTRSKNSKTRSRRVITLSFVSHEVG